MKGEKMTEWEEDDEDEAEANETTQKESKSREGIWESGKGRCAVTGRRVLGGTSGLRRVMV
jgi:peroxin-12